MADFFTRIGTAVTEAANKASQGVKDFSDQNRINNEIGSLRIRKEKVLRDMGQLVYNFIKYGGDTPDYNASIAKVDEIDAKIEVLEKQIAVIKGSALCPMCNGTIAPGDVFCANCGYKVGQTQN